MGFRSIFGGGKIAVPGKNVKVCYEGCFPDGRVFDKNQNRRRPLQFRIGKDGVLMQFGGERGVGVVWYAYLLVLVSHASSDSFCSYFFFFQISFRFRSPPPL